jgi:adenylate cyclase
MPHLKYRDPDGETVLLELQDRELVLGRLPSCDVIIPSSVVSRKHARIFPREGGWWIADLGSPLGTFVNRIRIQDETVLRAGDQIAIGEQTISFSDRPAATGRTAPAPSGSSSATAIADLPVTDPFGSTDSRPVPGVAPEVVERQKVEEGPLVRTAMSAQSLDLRDLAAPARSGVRSSENELLALVRIADGIHRCPDVQSICRTALEMAMRATGADRGAMAVRDEVARDFVHVAELHASGTELTTAPVMVSRTFVRDVMREKVALFAHDTGADSKLSMAQSVVALEIRSILAAPLWDGDRILGYLYLDSTGKGRLFGPRDLDLISVIGFQTGTAISRLKLADKIREEQTRRTDLARFFSADVIRHIEEEGRQGRLDPALSAHEQVVTVLFSDIQGFTSLGEGLEPGDLKVFLDDYFDRMTEIIVDHCLGTLDKYMGDGIMALFGAPFSRGEADDARRAVDAAVRMRESVEGLRKDYPQHAKMAIRIGINTGKVIAGMMGSRRRLEYSVVGDAVNVASRLESTCEAGRIQIGDSTWQLVKTDFDCAPAGERQVKNRAQPVRTYWVS